MAQLEKQMFDIVNRNHERAAIMYRIEDRIARKLKAIADGRGKRSNKTISN